MSVHEEDLSFDERQLAAFLETAPDGRFLVDLDGIIVMVNEKLLDAVGWPRHELVGRSALVLVPPRVRDESRESFREFANLPWGHGVADAREVAVCRRDGTDFPAEVSITPMATSGGLRISVALRDLSRRHQEEKRFRGLLEAAPDAMVIVGTEGTIVLVNAQVERLFGHSRTELIGQPIEVLVPERFTRVHQAHRERYVSDPKPRGMGAELELYAVRADGSEFPVEISLAPLETDEGLLVSAAIRDVSERKRIQADTDRMKDTFFATVSHELRTPLTSVLGYAELLDELDEAHLSTVAKRLLAVITRNAARELRLVDDLLTLVKIEEGDLSIRPRRCDLRAVVDHAVEAGQPHAKELDLVLTLVTEESDALVHGDPDRLGQAFDNLISNALKFTPPGGAVTVDLRCEGEAVVVEVADTGSGIRDTDRPRLFDRLYRGAEAVSSHVPGAGLGLPIVKAIIDAHRGRIEVETVLGFGTTFRTTLPRIERVAGLDG